MITRPGEWNPSLLDDKVNASEQCLKQLYPTSQDAIDNFYNMQGDIIVQRNNVDSVTSDNSSTSSGSKRWSYQERTRKEKQKHQHRSKLSLLSSKPEFDLFNGLKDMFCANILI